MGLESLWGGKKKESSKEQSGSSSQDSITQRVIETTERLKATPQDAPEYQQAHDEYLAAQAEWDKKNGVSTSLNQG